MFIEFEDLSGDDDEENQDTRLETSNTALGEAMVVLVGSHVMTAMEVAFPPLVFPVCLH